VIACDAKLGAGGDPIIHENWGLKCRSLAYKRASAEFSRARCLQGQIDRALAWPDLTHNMVCGWRLIAA
jgi:hypothetical protein